MMDEFVGSVQNEKTAALVPKASEEKSAVSPAVCVFECVCLHPGC